MQIRLLQPSLNSLLVLYQKLMEEVYLRAIIPFHQLMYITQDNNFFLHFHQRNITHYHQKKLLMAIQMF